jgi:uncharacterized protein GlcG (DUF336 family)
MKKIASLVAVATLSMASASAFAQTTNQGAETNDCTQLPTHTELTTALDTALSTTNNGLDFDMWATVVNRFGVVCAVTAAAYSAPGTEADPWSASRVISAQKANTANSLSTDSLALSTANLYSAVQSGGSLFGLQESNPVDVRVAYLGDPKNYGTATDAMVGLKIGGVNVFGGGLALYNSSGELVGAVGVSGDFSCADHNIAWRTRNALTGLGIANTPGGVGPATVANENSSGNSDNIANDIVVDAATGMGVSTSGWGHPNCGTAMATQASNF